MNTDGIMPLIWFGVVVPLGVIAWFMINWGGGL